MALMKKLTLIALSFWTTLAFAQPHLDQRLAEAGTTVAKFLADESLPADVIERAYGIAVLPNVVRAGFFIGGRRGKGVMVVKTPDGAWSNPAFIQLTGGSIGWQIGAETADIILIFANEASVENIANGRFTLGGDATAIAGPVGRRTTAVVLFKSEVYIYIKSQGLFAGASFEGTRLGIDRKANDQFYSAGSAAALAEQSTTSPSSARRFLLSLEPLNDSIRQPQDADLDSPARTFPLEDGN